MQPRATYLNVDSRFLNKTVAISLEQSVCGMEVVLPVVGVSTWVHKIQEEVCAVAPSAFTICGKMCYNGCLSLQYQQRDF